MDIIHSIIAVGATLAGLWTSAILHDVKSSDRDHVAIAATSETRSRSIDLSLTTIVRAAPAPSLAKPIR